MRKALICCPIALVIWATAIARADSSIGLRASCATRFSDAWAKHADYLTLSSERPDLVDKVKAARRVSMAAFESAASCRPIDGFVISAITRVGGLQESEGATDRAAASYEDAIRLAREANLPTADSEEAAALLADLRARASRDNAPIPSWAKACWERLTAARDRMALRSPPFLKAELRVDGEQIILKADRRMFGLQVERRTAMPPGKWTTETRSMVGGDGAGAGVRPDGYLRVSKRRAKQAELRVFGYFAADRREEGLAVEQIARDAADECAASFEP